MITVKVDRARLVADLRAQKEVRLAKHRRDQAEKVRQAIKDANKTILRLDKMMTALEAGQLPKDSVYINWRYEADRGAYTGDLDRFIGMFIRDTRDAVSLSEAQYQDLFR